MASDYEVVPRSDYEVASDFEVVAPAGTLNPMRESVLKTAWARLTDPRNLRTGGPAGILRNIQEAGSEIGGGIGEAYGSLLAGGGPISRLWDVALPTGPETPTGRDIREESERAFRRGGEVTAEVALDPLNVGPLAAIKPLRVLRKLETPVGGVIPQVAGEQAGKVIGALRRHAPEPAVVAPEPVVAPTGPREYQQPTVIVRKPPIEPEPSDFVITERAAERPPVSPGPEIPTAAQQRPELLPPEKPMLFDPYQRPVRAEHPVARAVEPEQVVSTVEEGRPLRRTVDVAEGKTGGPTQPIGLTEPQFRGRVREEAITAESEIERALREGTGEAKPAPRPRPGSLWGRERVTPTPSVPDEPLRSTRDIAAQRAGEKPRPLPEAVKVPDEVVTNELVPEAAVPKRKPKTWGQTFKEMLPQEEFVRRARPDSPVITDMEWYNSELAWRMKQFTDKPFWKEIRKLEPEELKSLEDAAVKAFKARGETPEALEASIAKWPEPLKEYIRWRNESLVEEAAGREALGLDVSRELAGPHLPRLTDFDLSEIVRVPHATSKQILQTTVKGAEEHRRFATTKAGEEAGHTFLDPRNSILLREYSSIRQTQTARLMQTLKNRAIFETPEAAKAVSPTKEAFPISGLPGSDVYWAATKPEAIFLSQNLTKAPTGLVLPGRLGGLKNYADVLFRNPNLVNPAPHVVKNMGAKYLLAARTNARKLPGDMVEFFRESNPKMLAEFKEYMPFAETDPAFVNLRRQMISSGSGEAMLKNAEHMLSLVNKGSAKVVFKWADPAMRYSLFKHYRTKGMEPQVAANHAWIDLVRYGTRSDITDFWKSIPMNFFVPWRVGTYTSVLKQITTHPVKAALTIGAVDLLRELRYRETGRWTHLPWDYIEGPITLMIEHPEKLGREAVATALFGPVGEMTVRNIEGLLGETPKNSNFMKEVGRIFWGLSQFYDPAKELFEEYQKDGNPKHFTNAVLGLLLGEREALSISKETGRVRGRAPSRLLEFVPESVLPKSRSLRGRERSATQLKK